MLIKRDNPVSIHLKYSEPTTGKTSANLQWQIDKPPNLLRQNFIQQANMSSHVLKHTKSAKIYYS